MQVTRVRQEEGGMLGWRAAVVAFLGSTCLLQAQRDAGADLQPRADFVTRRVSCRTPWFGTCCLSLSPSQISKKALPYVARAIGRRG